MLVGSNKQNLSLQVDTGSSDLVRLFPFRPRVYPKSEIQMKPVGGIDIMFDVLVWASETGIVRLVEFETDGERL